MSEKKKPNYFLRILLISFIVFLGLYIAISNGYYEKTLSNQVMITNENIDEFEKDIKSGKPIDMKKYQNIDDHDYGNVFSNSGKYLGNKIDYLVHDGVKDVSNILIKLFGN